ncbi:transcription termination factor MTEF18, mitochondrial-like isoform X2 [Euphorbia lathyris]|uniref:transcription termination factor MTEF18, mitochondrial-like isoform X2 n=1 Tax=Euphorbia lathyris TaxID=212925 RepID=UPI0033138F4A
MTLLHKLRTPATLKLASISVDFYKIIICQSANSPRFYKTRGIVRDGMDRDIACQISNASIKQAQAALLDYLHCTRSLQFSDAEHISRNSPNFLGKLLKKVSIADSDIGESITRLLCFHPINEFEPFFESSGLVPYQYKPLLKRDLMFLTDDDLLLENYHVLCNYGIPRNKIGKIYEQAGQVFRYEYGVLALKLKAYEELGFEQSFMAKMIVCSPYLLIGDVNVDFIKSMEILRKGGRQCCWIEQHLSENSSINWSQLHTLLNLLRNTAYSEEDLSLLLSRHPGIVFESSGEKTLSLIGFLLKFGSSMNQICHMFLQFPQLPVGKFLLNLRGCFLFLNEIDMEAVDIQKIICSHSLLLGSYALKKTNTLICTLKVGKKRIRNVIMQNPKEMKNWVMGSTFGPLPNLGERKKSQMLKIKFLTDLGFEENSREMVKALKVFRGKGAELQERFDCIMQAGLDRKDVIEMVKSSPQILNQKKEVLKMKIDFCVNDLRCPVSYLVVFPSYLSYTIERVELRVAMYNWLKEQGTLGAVLSLSTVVACTENFFIRKELTWGNLT